ncbi:MAG: hypothetical protein DRJ06_00435 [Candidatus Aminicenantes bacterium]|nr:MAG: hypothetical protein DRJ06_00435 [Candidatus Aminicenantes bacterium]
MPQVTGMSYYVKAKENVSASVEIFKAIPSPSFSAPAKLRPVNSNLWTLFFVKMSSKTLNEPCSIGARRPRRPGSFENGSGRLNLQCGSHLLFRLSFDFVSPSLGTKPEILNKILLYFGVLREK